MIRLTLSQVAQICGGTVDDRFAGIAVSAVSTDTRKTGPGELFVAINGEHRDGHDFLEQAFDAGAAAAIVSRRVPGIEDRPLVQVADTLPAYGALAAHHRAGFDLMMVGITGSSGKTTTKNLVASVLGQVGKTLAPPGSENNEIGAPRLLLALDATYRFCVVEMAMRGPGEIAYLARMARPQIGCITNIGEAHIGRLGSREQLAQAKAELLAELPAGGRAVLNADDFFFGLFSEIAPCPVVSFGIDAEADVRARGLRPLGVRGSQFTIVAPCGQFEVTLQLPGKHNVANSLAAAAVGVAAGASCEQIRAGLEAAAAEQMRGQLLSSPRGFDVLNDAYNANPDSMAKALEMLSSAEGRKIAVLGDMLELGGYAELAHRQVGAQAAAAGVDWLVTVGELAAIAATEAEAHGVRADSVADASAAVALLKPQLEAGDTVLVKASRVLALERVVEGILGDD